MPDLVRCDACRLVQASAIPAAAELARVYEKDYFFGGEYSDYLRDRPALEKNFTKRLSSLKKYLTTQSTALEIGCSYGFFLNLCRNYVRECLGYDVAADAVKYARDVLGVDARVGTILDYQGQPVDIVFMWDVIEHLSDPDLAVKRVAEILKSGGHLVLTTGDIGSLVAKIRGRRWRMIHPPSHLFYFDKKTIAKLLQKHGLEVVQFGHYPIFRNLGSVMLQIAAKNKGNILGQFLEVAYLAAKKIGLDKINFGLNLVDIMEVVAVKN